MSTTTPRHVTGLRGTVMKGPYGQGSKSEREAVFIDTVEARYILRRKTGPVFGDDALSKYVGHEVACDGFVMGTTLLAEKIELVK